MRHSQLSAVDAIEHYAKSSPHAPALVEPDGLTLNYSALWAQIEAFADRLEMAGIGAGARIAVLLPQGALQVLALIGVSNRHAGILLQPSGTPIEVASSLSRLSASALITSPDFEAHIETAISLGLTVVVARKGGSLEDWQFRPPDSLLELPIMNSEARVFLFSSGTTGISKVLYWTAANIDAGIASRIRSAQFTSSDRLLLMMTLCNGAGIINLFSQFSVGGTVIATDGFDPSAYLHWLNDLKPTWYVCAPVVHQAALAQLKRETVNRPVSLRFLESAGAPLPEQVRQGLEQILEVPLLNVYGANEAQYIVRDTPLSRRTGSIPNLAGVSCGLEIRIIDSSGGGLPLGEEGEITVRGATVATGYVDNPQATRDAFHDGWFRTGDLGRLDQDGNLFVTGRLKEMINRGGQKIVPAEVDAVLESHPALREAASFPVSHPTLGEDVACAVVLRTTGESPISARELRRFAAERLPSFKVPRRIFFVDEIPRGELGKPQRWVLAERFNNKGVSPQSPAEEKLYTFDDDESGDFFRVYEIWVRILGREDLGFDEDFFEAGGDSLAAVNMLAEVDQRLGSQTSASAANFLDEPTLKQLVRIVGNTQPTRPNESSSSEIQIFPVREAGTSKQLFCIPPDGTEGLLFRRLATYLYGQMDLSIVRPANTFHSFALFSLEREGEEVAALIRRSQPEGPYYVSGFCYGGVVAFEAARQLSKEGQDVRLILYDAVMPGYPSLLSRFRRKLGGFWRISRVLRDHDPDETSSELVPIAPGRSRLSHFARLVAWRMMVPIRRLAIPFERAPLVQKFFTWAQLDYFPFYKPRSLYVPILHFITTDEHAGFDGAARFGWKKVARRGIDERVLPTDHPNLFHESNLPKIIDSLREWCGGF